MCAVIVLKQFELLNMKMFQVLAFHHVMLGPWIFCVTDEKEKYDPSAFRDAILQGLNEADNDIEQVVHSFTCVAFLQPYIYMTAVYLANDRVLRLLDWHSVLLINVNISLLHYFNRAEFYLRKKINFDFNEKQCG